MFRQVYDWNQAPNELYSAAIEAFSICLSGAILSRYPAMTSIIA